MTIYWWLSMAFAGTVRVHSATPVTVKVDGQIVGRVATTVTLDDVRAGAHTIQVCDALGAVLASTDVVVPEAGEPLWFDYYAHRLMPVERQLVPATATPIPDAAMASLEVHLAKKRSEPKRLKYFTKWYGYYWFEMRHVDSLLLAFDVIEDRILVCEMIAPRTLDPQNVGAIVDQFPIGEFRERGLAPFAAFRSAKSDEDE